MDNELINRIEEESEDMKRIIQEYSNGMRVVMIKNTSGIINYEITNADDSIIKFKISASDKKILSCESDCKKIIIPNNILAIGEQVFAGCRNLKEITIPESVTSIGKQAFYTCHN